MRPDSLPPAIRSTGSPVDDKPMLREKKGLPFSSDCREKVGALVSPPLMRPNSKISDSRRKKPRFSGKNRLNRSRFTCRVSTSVAEKSVFSVMEALSPGVTR